MVDQNGNGQVQEQFETQLENMLHVRVEGRSWDIPLADLTIGDQSTDNDIRTAAANWLGIPEGKLRPMRVDRNAETNSITLRPEATFG
jgi:hypothetical protein